MNSVKKLCILAVLLTFMLNSPKTAFANPETVVKVEPYQNVAGLGQQFTISIAILEAQNLFALEVKLYWNQSILQLTNTTVMLGVESYPNGVLHGEVYQNETVRSGEYMLWGTSSGQQTPSFNGSGTAVKLTFNVTEIGSCELTLQTKLYDKPPPGEAAEPIQHSTQSGYFSLIYLFCTPTQVMVGENINISGYVTFTSEKLSVLIQYGNETGWYPLGNTTTDSNGNYKYLWTTQKEGNYQIKATTTLSGTIVESAIQNVSVKPKGEIWPFTYLIITIIIIVTIILLIFYIRKAKAKSR
jgi:hypothetical protein